MHVGDNCAGWTINLRALEQSKAFAINVGCDYETNLDIVNCLRGLTIETILAGYNDSSFYVSTYTYISMHEFLIN